MSVYKWNIQIWFIFVNLFKPRFKLRYIGNVNIILIHTYNTNFLTTQYPISILYYSTQIQMDILYKKKVLIKHKFQDFWCTKVNNILICFENIQYVFKG
jgi:hypothetical protein